MLNKEKSKKELKRERLREIIQRQKKRFRIPKKNTFPIVFMGLGFGFLIWIFWGIPLPTNLTTKPFAVSTKIYDRKGVLVYEIFTDQKRTPLALSEIPENIREATIAIEDK